MIKKLAIKKEIKALSTQAKSKAEQDEIVKLQPYIQAFLLKKYYNFFSFSIHNLKMGI